MAPDRMNRHTVTVRVRYGETDPMGLVHHAHYFVYFEMGRTELLRAAGLAYKEIEKRGVLLVVTDAGCRYHESARYDDTLSIDTRVAGLGKATVRFEYSVLGPGGRLLAEGHTELAAVNREGKPVRLPAGVAELLR